MLFNCEAKITLSKRLVVKADDVADLNEAVAEFISYSLNGLYGFTCGELALNATTHDDTPVTLEPGVEMIDSRNWKKEAQEKSASKEEQVDFESISSFVKHKFKINEFSTRPPVQKTTNWLHIRRFVQGRFKEIKDSLDREEISTFIENRLVGVEFLKDEINYQIDKKSRIDDYLNGKTEYVNSIEAENVKSLLSECMLTEKEHDQLTARREELTRPRTRAERESLIYTSIDLGRDIREKEYRIAEEEYLIELLRRWIGYAS